MPTYRTIDGRAIDVLSPAPTGSGGSIIQCNFEALADTVAARLAFYISPLLNFTQAQDTDLATIPDGYVFFLDRFEALVLTADNVTTLATVRLGNDTDRDSYFGFPLSESSASSESDDEVNALILPSSPTWPSPYRRVFMAQSGSFSIDTAVFVAGQNISAGIATPATAASHTGKLLIYGMMVQTT